MKKQYFKCFLLILPRQKTCSVLVAGPCVTPALQTVTRHTNAASTRRTKDSPYTALDYSICITAKNMNVLTCSNATALIVFQLECCAIAIVIVRMEKTSSHVRTSNVLGCYVVVGMVFVFIQLMYVMASFTV